jgi:hypothetical protein
MSWFGKLFGGGGSNASDGAGADGPEEEYNGYVVRARLMPAGSEFQLAGRIEKDGKSYDFVRADRFSSRSEAQSATLAKARQIIDEQGDRLFGQTWPAKSN